MFPSSDTKIPLLKLYDVNVTRSSAPDFIRVEVPSKCAAFRVSQGRRTWFNFSGTRYFPAAASYSTRITRFLSRTKFQPTRDVSLRDVPLLESSDGSVVHVARRFAERRTRDRDFHGSSTIITLRNRAPNYYHS